MQKLGLLRTKETSPDLTIASGRETFCRACSEARSELGEVAQGKAYNSQEAPGGRVTRQRRNYTSQEAQRV